MVSSHLTIIILAAGKGTRMHSDLPKVMHPLAGQPMLTHVLNASLQLEPSELVVVVGPEMESVKTLVKEKSGNIPITLVEQTERLGTGHAVTLAMEAVTADCGTVLVLYGDTPLLMTNTLKTLLLQQTHPSPSAVTVVGFYPEHPGMYGRIVTQSSQMIDKIVEYQEATETERAINCCNSGVMAGDIHHFRQLLPRLTNHNRKGEYYLTDIVELARAQLLECRLFTVQDANEVTGINSRAELAQAEKIIQHRLRKQALETGVTLIDPDTIHLCSDTRFGRDVILHPYVVFGPQVIVEDQVEILSFSHISGAHIHSQAKIGPFARVRPKSVIGAGSRIGNFVELKQASLEENVKANHLSYLGDVHIGTNSNIGAGTITCNYDGKSKHATTIGENCFVGSNTSLIAPVVLHDHCIIGAGSVINRDVPADALGIARVDQHNYPGKAQDLRNRAKKP